MKQIYQKVNGPFLHSHGIHLPRAICRTNEIVYRDYINIGFAAATPKVR